MAGAAEYGLRGQSRRGALRCAACAPGSRYTARGGELTFPESRPPIQSMLRPWCAPSLSFRRPLLLPCCIGGTAFSKRYAAPKEKVPGIYKEVILMVWACLMTVLAGSQSISWTCMEDSMERLG